MIVVSDTSCISNLLSLGQESHETVGRVVALREGLAIIGLVGVLVTAKQRGLLPSVGPVLQQLENEAGFRLSQSLKADTLRVVGEA